MYTCTCVGLLEIDGGGVGNKHKTNCSEMYVIFYTGGRNGMENIGIRHNDAFSTKGSFFGVIF